MTDLNLEPQMVFDCSTLFKLSSGVGYENRCAIRPLALTLEYNYILITRSFQKIHANTSHVNELKRPHGL